MLQTQSLAHLPYYSLFLKNLQKSKIKPKNSPSWFSAYNVKNNNPLKFRKSGKIIKNIALQRFSFLFLEANSLGMHITVSQPQFWNALSSPSHWFPSNTASCRWSPICLSFAEGNPGLFLFLFFFLSGDNHTSVSLGVNNNIVLIDGFLNVLYLKKILSPLR